MRADVPVVLDACVLANYGVADLILRLAEDWEAQLVLPLWTEEILREVYRVRVEKLGWTERRASHIQAELLKWFPESLVTGYEKLIPACNNHDGDRHVLAAATRAKAAAIVTFNLKHFPRGALEEWDIEAIHPDEFLLTRFEHQPDTVMEKLEKIASKLESRIRSVLERLSRSVPRFAERVSSELGGPEVESGC